MISSAFLKRIENSSRLIGCNIYFTAGADKRHRPIITNLVQRTQNLFADKSSPRFVGENNETAKESDITTERYDVGALVHTYTDKVYNRTSFHMAGTPDIVLDVAVDMIIQTFREIQKVDHSNVDPKVWETSHPHVGIIDNVAVVPLVSGAEARMVDPYTTFAQWFVSTHGADVARKIGLQIRDQLNVNIFYYGLAQQKRVSLFKVRKRVTNFFESGGRITTGTFGSETPTTECCTVGAPEEFAENFNIRLKDGVSKKAAQFLSRLVRERDGGLDGVEALALPYSKNRWEVGCNVLRPNAGGATIKDIKKVVYSWDEKRGLIEKGYRVGTTREESIKVLEAVSRSATNRKNHDENVMKQQLKYFEIEE